jgi:hypothetical protein
VLLLLPYPMLLLLLLLLLLMCGVQMMAGMPLKPEDVSYSPYETYVRDRGV